VWQRRLTSTLVLAGLVGVCAGVYGLLDGGSPDVAGLPVLGAPLLLAGLTVAGVGFVVAGRRVRRSRYRPDPWALPEWLVSGCGVVAGGTLVVAAAVGVSGLVGEYAPPAWPALPLLPAAGILVGLLPAWVSPRPRAPQPSPARRDVALAHAGGEGR
jgi:energy-coupling factor transport system permease protein